MNESAPNDIMQETMVQIVTEPRGAAKQSKITKFLNN